MVFVVAPALFAWASSLSPGPVQTSSPAANHHHRRKQDYRITRNPIYFGMFLGLIGLAIAFDNPWLLIMLVPFALVIRYGVLTSEEAYLERKFGDVYRGYRSRVRPGELNGPDRLGRGAWSAIGAEKPPGSDPRQQMIRDAHGLSMFQAGACDVTSSSRICPIVRPLYGSLEPAMCLRSPRSPLARNGLSAQGLQPLPGSPSGRALTKNQGTGTASVQIAIGDR
jgi:hypothetical protein